MNNILTIFMLLPMLSMAQTHIKNQRFFQFQAGAYNQILPEKGNVSLSASTGKYNKNFNAFSVGFTYQKKEANAFTATDLLNIDIPVEQYFLFGKFETKVIENASKTFIIKPVVKLNFGYHSINGDNDLLQNNFIISQQSSFILGGGVGMEAEIFNVLLGVESNYNFLNRQQRFATTPYVGYKLHLRP